MENSVQILSTGQLDNNLLQEAASEGIHIEVMPFIKTMQIENVEVQQEVETALLLSATVVFTSANAVEAVAGFLFDEQPDWKIYCIGNTTRKLVEKYFGEYIIVASASCAAELADLILDNEEIEEVIFFCGDSRREELPEKLRDKNMLVTEIVVYQTILIQHTISNVYNGILFFSPSAAESFFVNNKPSLTTVLFAIGNTTAASLEKYTSNKIIIAEQPGKMDLIRKLIEYFT